MALREEIRKKQEEYFATATIWQKISYLIQYYGVRTLLIGAALLFIGSFIYHHLTDPDTVLNGTFVNYDTNRASIKPEELANNFLSTQKIDTNEYTAEFYTNIRMQSAETSANRQIDSSFSTQIGSGVFDFTVCPLDILKTYAYGNYFVDLTTILSKEQIKTYEPYFLYIDMEVLAERHNKLKDIPLPDPQKPEDMGKPIPVMLNVSSSSIIQEIYGEDASNICYAIIPKGEHGENAIKFLEYIFPKS